MRAFIPTGSNRAVLSIVCTGVLLLAQAAPSLAQDSIYTIVDVKVFDARGNVSMETVPYVSGETVKWTNYRYDGLDRPILVTNPDGTAVTTQYLTGDAFSAVQVTDELGHKSIRHLDAYGNTVYLDRYVGSTKQRTTYDYDVLNRLTDITDPIGAQWHYEYDGHSNQVLAVDPDLGCRQMTYDVANRLTSVASADGALTSYTYDALDRVLTKTVNKDALQVPDWSNLTASGN